MTTALGIIFGTSLLALLGLAVWARHVATKLKWTQPPPGSTRLFGWDEAGGRLMFQHSARDALPEDVILREDSPMPATGRKERKSPRFPTDVLDGIHAGATLYAASAAWSDTAVAKTFDRIGHDFDKLSILDSQGIANSAPALGYASWLKGHIAETLAAEHLTATGHTVTFAETSNHPGWDLVVDGQEYNVKVGETAPSSIRAHFDKYPEIPVITAESKAELLNNEDVVGLPVLEGDVVAHAVGESLDSLGALEAADIGVPIFTVVRTSWRELRIQVDHGNGDPKQVIGESLATAAVISGALFLFPIGVPALLAGLGGLILKGKVVATVQAGQLNRDIEWFDDRFRPTREAIRQADSGWSRVAKKIEQKQTARLKRELEQVKHDLDLQVSSLALSATNDLRNLGSGIAQAFDVLRNGIEEDRVTVLHSAPARSRFMQRVWPSRAYHLQREQLRWLDETESRLEWHRKRISEAVARIEAGSPITQGLKSFSTAIQDFATEYFILPRQFQLLGSEALKRAFGLANALDGIWENAIAKSIPIRNRCMRDGHTLYQNYISQGIHDLLKRIASHGADWQIVAAQAQRANMKIESPIGEISNWLETVNKRVLESEPLQWTVGTKHKVPISRPAAQT